LSGDLTIRNNGTVNYNAPPGPDRTRVTGGFVQSEFFLGNGDELITSSTIPGFLLSEGGNVSGQTSFAVGGGTGALADAHGSLSASVTGSLLSGGQHSLDGAGLVFTAALPQWTPGQIERAREDVRTLKLMAIEYSLAATLTPCDGPCAVMQAMLSFAAWKLDKQIAHDPVDNNFRQIAQPSSPKVPDVGVFNMLAADVAKAAGLIDAASTSLNRAQGAFLAHDSFWQQQQQAAADSYISQLAKQLQVAGLDVVGQKTLLLALGVQLNITPDDVSTFQTRLTSLGFPPDELNTFSFLGLDPSSIAQIRDLLAAQDINGVAGLFPDDLAAFGQALIVDSQGLEPVPEPATLLLWGTSMAGLGFASLWRRRRRKRQP
jgi:hypothetical protein